jgi:hypothetical protein
MFFSFHSDYSDGEVALPECHRVKRKDMKLFCFFLDVFIAGFRSATVVFALISYISPQNWSKFDPIYQKRQKRGARSDEMPD